jgi:phosphomannomutase
MASLVLGLAAAGIQVQAVGGVDPIPVIGSRSRPVAPAAGVPLY